MRHYISAIEVGITRYTLQFHSVNTMAPHSPRRVTAFAVPCLAVLAITLATTAVLPRVVRAQVRAQDAVAQARIVLPSADQPVRGTVAVVGTATSPAFLRYEIAYAQEPEAATWVSLGGSIQPVDNGQLGIWDTRPLADGAYALRIQVFGSDGSLTEALVRNIAVSNPTIGATTGATSNATSGADTSAGTGVVAEVQSARDTLSVVAATLSQIPDALLRGARLALFAFAALGAYVLLKRLVLYIAHRVTRRPTDYGG
jgi:hypothetical protein